MHTVYALPQSDFDELYTAARELEKEFFSVRDHKKLADYLHMPIGKWLSRISDDFQAGNILPAIPKSDV